MSYRYLAAVDMGGTKAEGVVFREDGEVVCRVVEKGGAPFDNGVDYSITNLCKCIDSLIAGAPEMPVSLYIGAAACADDHTLGMTRGIAVMRRSVQP